MNADGIADGPDGRPRCWWAVSAPDYVAYHDEEWGRPITGDRGIYERLTLEAFQSGLSWLTILRKRENFRAAFDGFEPAAVAAYEDADIARLIADVGIVRNRAKIEAAIANARATVKLASDGGSLAELVWSCREDGEAAPADKNALPAKTPASLASELKRLGFRFVGPTTAYALMQACGVVNDHLAECFVRAEVEEARAQVR